MLVNACNYLFHLLNSRQLGVDGYGVLASLIALLSLALAPSTIIQLVVAKTAAELHAVDDEPRLRRLAVVVVRLAFVSFIAICVVGAAFERPLAAFLNVHDVATVLLTIAAIAATLVLPGARGVFQGLHDFRALALSTSLESIGRLAFGVGLVSLGLGVRGAVAGVAVGAAFSIAYTLLAIRRYSVGESARLRLDLSRLIQTVGGTTVATISISVLSFADMLLVKHLFDPRQAGLYSALSLIGKIFLFAVSFLPTVLLPSAVKRASSGQDPRPLLLQAGVLAVAVSGCGTLACALDPEFVVRVVAGSAFIGAAPLLLPYASAMAMLGLANAAIVYKIGLHQFDFVGLVSLIAVAELTCFALFHVSLGSIVRTVLIGHTCVLLSTVRGLRASPATAVAAAQAEVA